MPYAMKKNSECRSGLHDGAELCGGFAELIDRRVCILTFGCTYNHGDSRKLEALLISRGCQIVPDPEYADALVVNTCTVIGSTERKMKRILRKYRAMPLFVTGCMFLVQKEAILEECDPVFIHPDEIDEGLRTVSQHVPSDIGIVQIGKGCNGSCTYCITRHARGQLVNRNASDILTEIKRCHESGATEIRLCAQDCGAWNGKGGENLGDLLSLISQIPGSLLIRVGMMNPETLLPVLDPVIASFRNERIFRFIHVPVQSGSDRILSSMGRHYTTEDFIGIVKEFRKKIPDITIATDIIAGFPGEQEEDFNASLDLLSLLMPSKVNITRYSPRPLTSAALKKDLTDRIKKERSRRIQNHAEMLYSRQNQALIGQIIGVTVTERLRKGSFLCRSNNYTGVVVKGNLPTGTRINVRIRSDQRYFFFGEQVA